MSQLQTGPLFVRLGALARGDLSLSVTQLAWSGIGHAASPNTLGCMASAGLDCVGDRPVSTRSGLSVCHEADVEIIRTLQKFVLRVARETYNAAVWPTDPKTIGLQ